MKPPVKLVPIVPPSFPVPPFAPKVALVGVGGTGSYVLDFVSKTPVAEIHIYDGDDLLTHNALRAPGAVSVELLNTRPKKVNHWRDVYSRLHKHVIAHEKWLDEATTHELLSMDFVFVCLDDERAKRTTIDALNTAKIPLVDVGIGINLVDGALTGSVRTTLATSDKSDHLAERVSLGAGAEDEYGANIQIAELNALNAALAVIKWKKHYGYYHDLEREHNSVYDINVNRIQNDEYAA